MCTSPGGVPGVGAGREAAMLGRAGAGRRDAGSRRPSPESLASHLTRLTSPRLSDRHARIRAAPVGLVVLQVGPAAPPRPRRGQRGGPARVPAAAPAAPALPGSCLPPLHPCSGLAGSGEDCAPGDAPGQTLSGRRLTFPRAVAGARLPAFAGQRARPL